ncbi:MAG TPA: M50 family metallopeptidase [Mycobacteriales bacterium]|nr:M50 family metallopeptidase [Mycobacteriales bacterium]
MLHYLGDPYELLGVIVASVLCLGGHNLAQVWAARLLGDREPARQGFAQLTSKRHVEPLGVVAFALCHFGWGFAAPVPITVRFRRQRSRAAICLLAGPACLFLLTLLFTWWATHARSEHWAEFTVYAAMSSAGWFITSCLPIPPATGGRLVFLYAPATPGWQRARYWLTEGQTGALIVLAVLLLPILFNGLPNVVDELARPLLRNLASAVGPDVSIG